MANRRKKPPEPQRPQVSLEARPSRLRHALIALVAVAALMGVARLVMLVRNPDTPLLMPAHGANWICLDTPVYLKGRGPSEMAAAFRIGFEVQTAPSNAVLTFRAYRQSRVFLNGEEILGFNADPEEWKHDRSVDLAPHLTVGVPLHVLVVEVYNHNAHPALLASCEALRLKTDATWHASDGGNWTPARLAAAPRQADLSREFPPAEVALFRSLPLLLPVFGLVAFWCWATRQPQRFPWAVRWLPSPSTVRWIVVGAWVVLAANNISKLPAHIGFDVRGHLEYIQFIMRHHALPLATDGWQMFQSPLYYMISVPIAEITSSLVDEGSLRKVLRIIPLLCGIVQVELCFRALRMVFPTRGDLQALGTVVGGLLPMNLYMSQAIGNEPLAGVLTAATICMLLALAYGSDRCRSKWWLMLTGVVFGLALLTKVTPILLVPIVVGWMMSISWMRGEQVSAGLRQVVTVLAMAALVSAWFYVRNWVELGKPFIGGWDPSREIVWWQDPSFRTLNELVRFGQSLRYPVFASIAGFWDSLYSTLWLDGSLSSIIFFEKRPPWNDTFLLAGSLLGLIPMALLMFGSATGVTGNNPTVRRGGIVLALVCVLVYLAAIFNLYLQIPIYSTAKATYALGLLPCFAILIVAGVDVVGRHVVGKIAAFALLATWAVCAYVAYFVI